MPRACGYDRLREIKRSCSATRAAAWSTSTVRDAGRSRRLATRGVALRFFAATGRDTVGVSVHAPGAYAEQMLVQESLMMPVPNGLPSDVAA